MTDARLPGFWLNKMRFSDLSDEAWRVFTNALMWSAEQGTDGHIPDRYVPSLHALGRRDAANQELSSADLWEPTDDGFQILEWSTPARSGGMGQSRAAEVEEQRERNRRKQQASRDRRKALRSEMGGGYVTGDVTGYVPRDVGPRHLTKKEGVESPFCDRHTPGGSGGVPCRDCADARRSYDAARDIDRNRPTPLPPRKSDLCPVHEWNRRDQCTEPHDDSGDRPDALVSLSGVPHAS